jgi:hypothetical protein
MCVQEQLNSSRGETRAHAICALCADSREKMPFFGVRGITKARQDAANPEQTKKPAICGVPSSSTLFAGAKLGETAELSLSALAAEGKGTSLN